jgi:plastocyanin
MPRLGPRSFLRRHAAPVLAAASLLSLAGLTIATNVQGAAESAVSIDNFTFGPPELTVAAGSQVVWVNRDDIPHTVMSTDRSFRSKPLDTDDKFSFTFDKAGTYKYFCSIHPKMVGTIVVR